MATCVGKDSARTTCVWGCQGVGKCDLRGWSISKCGRLDGKLKASGVIPRQDEPSTWGRRQHCKRCTRGTWGYGLHTGGGRYPSRCTTHTYGCVQHVSSSWSRGTNILYTTRLCSFCGTAATERSCCSTCKARRHILERANTWRRGDRCSIPRQLKSGCFYHTWTLRRVRTSFLLRTGAHSGCCYGHRLASRLMTGNRCTDVSVAMPCCVCGRVPCAAHPPWETWGSPLPCLGPCLLAVDMCCWHARPRGGVSSYLDSFPLSSSLQTCRLSRGLHCGMWLNTFPV